MFIFLPLRALAGFFCELNLAVRIRGNVFDDHSARNT